MYILREREGTLEGKKTMKVKRILGSVHFFCVAAQGSKNVELKLYMHIVKESGIKKNLVEIGTGQ
jgi:hypothetical protein